MTPEERGAIRYPAGAMVRAQQLREYEDFTFDRIAEQIMREYGFRPAKNTVRRWVDPEAAEDQANRNKRNALLSRLGRHGARLGRKDHTVEYQAARACALRAKGLSVHALSIVMSHDYPGQGWSRVEKVHTVLGETENRGRKTKEQQ